MKKSAASLAVLGALVTTSVSAQVNIQGSDTLEGIIRDLVESDCRSFLDSPPNPPKTIDPANNAKMNGFIRYVGGGSGTAPTAMLAALSGSGQQVAGPMSRALNSAECTAAEAARPGAAASSMGLVIGLDGIVIVGDSQNSETCGGNHTVHLDDELPGPLFSNMGTGWKAQISLLYTGVGVTGASDINRNCATPERKALAASYASLFSGGCSDPAVCPGGITHAFRRGDLSGTTDTFLSLVGLPAIKKNASGVVTATPFCNGLDTEDRDPIRRTCTAQEQVCEFDGSLGLVLPIVVPTTTNETAALYNAGNTSDPALSPLYYNRDPSPAGDVAPAGSFALTRPPACPTVPSPVVDPTGTLPVASASTVGYNLPSGATFPNDLRCDCRFPVPESYTAIGLAPNPHFTWNKRFGGKCFGTLHKNPDGSGRYGVLNGDNGSTDNSPTPWGNRFPQSGKNRCCRTGSPLTFYKQDPRLMNLVVRNPVDSSGPGTCLGGQPNGTGCPAPAFYRIHSSSLGQSVVGAADSGIESCRETDATRQIACLVQWTGTSNCSVGFAGREAGDSQVALTAEPFALNGISSTVLNIQKSVSTDPVLRAAAYPLARKLYYNTFIGFDNDVLVNPSGAATNAVQAQYNLYKCLADTARRTNVPIAASVSALDAAGYVELPGGPKLCKNMCTSNTSCFTLDTVPAADLLPAFFP